MGKEEDIANVLIVDSDPEVARLILEILARKGIRGHLVDDKGSAIDFIDKGSCDLVFTGETIDPRPDRASRPHRLCPRYPGKPQGLEYFESLTEDQSYTEILPLQDNKRKGTTDRLRSSSVIHTSKQLLNRFSGLSYSFL